MPSDITSQSGPWLKLADYGDWTHSQGLQRLSRRAAEKMAASFRSLRGRLARKFGGVPVYIGHPDDPEYARMYPNTDTRAYAWITDLQARPDGLYILPKWSPEGRGLLRNAFYKFLSPRWSLRAIGGGQYEPEALLSVGLTNQPNIPGEVIANSRLPHSPQPPADDAPNRNAGSNADNVSASEVASLIEEIAELKKEVERFYRLATDAQDARAEAEKALAEAEAYTHAAPGNEDSRTAGNEAATPASRTQNLVTRNCGLAARPRDPFLSAVNSRMQEAREDFASAWAHTRRARPDLYEQMDGANAA